MPLNESYFENLFNKWKARKKIIDFDEIWRNLMVLIFQNINSQYLIDFIAIKFKFFTINVYWNIF